MKNILLVILTFAVFSVYSQSGSRHTISIATTAPLVTDTTSLSSRINAKQALLVSGTGIKTINSTSMLGSGNLNIASIALPDADFYGSIYGNNGYVGSSTTTAKQTTTALDTIIEASTLATVKIALEGGSTFRGFRGINLDRGRVSVNSYNRDKSGKMGYPFFLGTTVYNSGWSLINTATYQQNITHTVGLGTGVTLGTSSTLYVIEIDTLLERTDPLAARRYLKGLTSTTAVDTTAGSYFCPIVTPSSSPVLISIHTSDGVSPNSNPKYRYEVVTTGGAISKNLTLGSYGSPLTVERVFAMDFGNGVGPVSSEIDSLYLNHGITMGNSIHQMGAGNFSTVKNWAFLGGDYTINQNSIVFYKAVGANETNTLKNCFFRDCANGVYTHTSNTLPNHGKLVVDDTYFFNTYANNISSANCDTIVVNNVYSDSVNLFTSTGAALTFITNSVVKNGLTFSWNGSNMNVDNSLFRTQYWKKASVFPIGVYPNAKVSLTNSLIHVKNYVPVGDESGDIFYNLDTSIRVKVKYNIFILDAPSGDYINVAHCNTYGGAGTGPDIWDYNVYILVGGTPRWYVSNASTNGGSPSTLTLAGWKTQSGQDSHSIFIDVRNYNAGLRQIFVDPESGNYNLTNTAQADSIRALGAGQRTPLGRFVSIPSRQQVVDIIQSEVHPSVANLMFNNGGGSIYPQVDRMTTAQRLALTAPEKGRRVYDTTLDKEYEYGTTWNALW